MSSPFLGEIRMFGGNFQVRGWTYCRGQLLSIASNDALFALIGTTYGGDGQSTFGVPNLQGRVPVHQGTLPGGQTYVIGQPGGAESVAVNGPQMPLHTHLAATSTTPGQLNTPAATTIFADTGPDAAPPVPTYLPFTNASQVALASTTVGLSGGSQAHENMQPTLAINYIIALEGIFPSRN